MSSEIRLRARLRRDGLYQSAFARGFGVMGFTNPRSREASA